MQAAIKQPALKKEAERRRKNRFPICRELRYKLMEDDAIVAQGTGESIDMASGGIAFTVSEQLKVGAYVEVSVSWPVLLQDNTRMRLVVFGRLVRANSLTAACTIEKYEFRTQARNENAVREIRRDSMLKRWVDDLRKDVLKTRTAIA
jgi:hypothetical protein